MCHWVFYCVTECFNVSLSVFAYIFCANFSDSNYCQCYFVSFFHLCPVRVNLIQILEWFTLIITISRDHCVQTKENLDCLINITIIWTETVVGVQWLTPTPTASLSFVMNCKQKTSKFLQYLEPIFLVDSTQSCNSKLFLEFPAIALHCLIDCNPVQSCPPVQQISLDRCNKPQRSSESK